MEQRIGRGSEVDAKEDERDLKREGVRMSYTLTIDEPVVASYVTRRGPQFRDEFNALLVAYVRTRMAYERAPAREETSGLAFARAWGQLCVEEGELDLSRKPETLRELSFS